MSLNGFYPKRNAYLDLETSNGEKIIITLALVSSVFICIIPVRPLKKDHEIIYFVNMPIFSIAWSKPKKNLKSYSEKLIAKSQELEVQVFNSISINEKTIF